ncbi:MAG: zinc ribbon domain-containing protein, partial [Firmicutes bacterium]|nr:zinc ribbon domain-containing protein [Bacillota bacterium]
MANKGKKKGGLLKGAILGAGAAVAADQILKKNGSSLGEKLGGVGEKLGLDGVGEKLGLGRKDQDRCPHCGAALEPGARFCGKCGRPVKPAAPPAPAEDGVKAAPPEAEPASVKVAPETPAAAGAAAAGTAAAGAAAAGVMAGAAAAGAAAAGAPAGFTPPSQMDGVRTVLARQLEGLRGYPPTEEELNAAVERYNQGLSPIDPAELEAVRLKKEAEARAALEKMNSSAPAGPACPECGAALEPGAKFCGGCGAPVS